MRVLIIGAGDIGYRIAMGLARTGRVSEIVLGDIRQGRGPWLAGMVALCGQTPARFVEVDGTRQSAVEDMLRAVQPNLVVQSGTLFSPFLITSRDDALAVALRRAGVALQLPRQLPLVLTLMQAARSVGLTCHICNLSAPDLTHPVLAPLDLAPTTGLGNVTMYWLRARAVLTRNQMQETGECKDPGLVRVLGHHNHGYAVFEAHIPEKSEERCRVYLGEDGTRSDDLPYRDIPIPRDISLNEVTAAAALVVLNAFLPGAPETRTSVPGPFGLPGGYPVAIDSGRMQLDLPRELSRDEAIAFNAAAGNRDGIDHVEADGTVHFTEAASEALRDIAPELVEPLQPKEALRRCKRILELLE